MNPACFRPRRREAFTLVEMLVVIAIIALLVAILIPAFGKVRQQAKVTQTSAQYSALDTGLEMFRAETDLGGGYPPSATDNPNDRQLIANPKRDRATNNNNGQDPVRVSGAQLLVHALNGADGLGPPGFRDFGATQEGRDGLWWNDTHDQIVQERPGAYAIDEETGRELRPRYGGGGGYVDDKMKESLQTPRQMAETGRIINLDPAGPQPSDLAVDEAVFTDSWGTPILYYRASRASHRLVTDERERGIYDPADNSVVTGLEAGEFSAHDGFDFGPGRIPGADGTLRLHALSNNTGQQQAFDEDEVERILSDDVFVDSFARFIIDPAVKARPTPVRKDSYLLISSGPDGRYGTADDVVNWARQQ